MLVAVGFDQSESIEMLESYRQRNGGTAWVMATAPAQMARDFRVLSQSTKLILDSDGVVLYREGYPAINEGSWRRVLDDVLG